MLYFIFLIRKDPFHSSSNLFQISLTRLFSIGLFVYKKEINYLCTKKNMNHIPRIIIIDYLLISFGIFLVIILLKPFGTRDFLQNNELPYLYYMLEGVFFFAIFIVSELLTTYIFKFPVDYSQSKDYQLRRIVSLAIPCILLNTIFDGEFFIIIRYGWEHWSYAWLDLTGKPSLRYFIHNLAQATSMGVFVNAFVIFLTYNRMQKYQIEELQSLNQMLDAEQKMLRSRLTKDNVTDKIIIHGDSRESLIVNPLDIMYVESVGNYLSIVYFNDSELCQKRLRSSLKEVEEALEAFPFMVHTHRAFLVNINFITQVSGNSAGYKISMFSTDHVLPVSKANVALFKEKISELGKKLK